MFTLGRVLKVSLVITIFVAALNLFGYGNTDLSYENILTQIILAFIFSFGLTAANFYFHNYIESKYSWEKETQKRLWFGAIGAFLVTMFTFALLRYLFYIYDTGDFSFTGFWARETLANYIIALVITVITILSINAFYFFRTIQKQEVKEQKIIAGTASARFDALKNQLDPHFLFNSLNVLTSLIEEDPHQAQKFTTSLSKVYRYVLEQKNKDLVTVDEELNFARTYVRLLKMRFEDSLDFDIPEKATNPEAKIVPLSLQLLLENAVKHNIVTPAKPLQLRVFEENGMLVVTNNIQEKAVVKKSSGVGLQNIKSRFSILTDRAVSIENAKNQFSVKLPMLSQQISVVETQEDHIEEKRYLKAKERVEQIKGFYGNLISYCLVIPFLWFINYRTTSFLWAIFPTLGWGIGLFFHGMEAFGYNPFLGSNWEEKKIRELMDKEDF